MATQEGLDAMEAVAAKAEAVTDFSVASAQAEVVKVLTEWGPTITEELTHECVQRGHKPHDLRAYGAVYKGLLDEGMIVIDHYAAQNRYSHGQPGGRVYRLLWQPSGRVVATKLARLEAELAAQPFTHVPWWERVVSWLQSFSAGLKRY